VYGRGIDHHRHILLLTIICLKPKHHGVTSYSLKNIQHIYRISFCQDNMASSRSMDGSQRTQQH
jgi:hypothetical protein